MFKNLFFFKLCIFRRSFEACCIVKKSVSRFYGISYFLNVERLKDKNSFFKVIVAFSRLFHGCFRGNFVKFLRENKRAKPWKSDQYLAICASFTRRKMLVYRRNIVNLIALYEQLPTELLYRLSSFNTKNKSKRSVVYAW